jgi:hypothetical protein
MEEHAEHIALEIPAVHATAQVIGDAPDGLVELDTLGIPGVAHDAVRRSDGHEKVIPAAP